jgi:hypothetical protein
VNSALLYKCLAHHFDIAATDAVLCGYYVPLAQSFSHIFDDCILLLIREAGELPDWPGEIEVAGIAGIIDVQGQSTWPWLWIQIVYGGMSASLHRLRVRNRDYVNGRRCCKCRD